MRGEGAAAGGKASAVCEKMGQRPRGCGGRQGAAYRSRHAVRIRSMRASQLAAPQHPNKRTISLPSRQKALRTGAKRGGRQGLGGAAFRARPRVCIMGVLVRATRAVRLLFCGAAATCAHAEPQARQGPQPLPSKFECGAAARRPHALQAAAAAGACPLACEVALRLRSLPPLPARCPPNRAANGPRR